MKPYKYKLEDDFEYQIPVDKKISINVLRNGKLWAALYKGRIVISKDYAWDGCSPKFNILDLFTPGTPDGRINVVTMKPKTYYASLVHDVFYQFRDELKVAVNRKMADQIFLQIMKENDFMLRYIYYAAVRIFGVIPYHIKGFY